MSALATHILQAKSSGPLALSRPADVAGAELADPLQDPIQLSVLRSDGIMQAASEGFSGGGGSLPFLDRIQTSFGRHDVSGVAAHTGSAASEAAGAMGAKAYASGGQVAFGGSPDLHTAAHEAAHVVQQQGGVQLAGGVGQAGDRYERNADAVADAVVQGKSAEGLLDPFAGGGGRGGGVQQVQLLEDVFSAVHFANPTAYLTSAAAGGAGASNKVVEEPGAQGILGVPDMRLINELGDPATRGAMLDRFDTMFNTLSDRLQAATDAVGVAEAGGVAATIADARAKETRISQNRTLLGQVMANLNTIVDLPSAGLWYRGHTLALSKLNLSPKQELNAGNPAAANHKSFTFHKDAGLLQVDRANLQGSAAEKLHKEESLNGPWGTGFVRGHGTIGNMKHRFIEHIHVNKGAADAIDIYNGTAAMGLQAEAWEDRCTTEDAALHGTDKAERDKQLTDANAADIATLTARQNAIDAAAAAAAAAAAPAPAADEAGV